MNVNVVSQRELIVVSETPFNRAEMTATAFSPSPLHAGINEILAKFSATVAPVFNHASFSSARVSSMEALPIADDAFRFARVAADDSKLESMAALLNEHPEVSAAYIKPAVYPPIAPPLDVPVGAPASASYESRQGYLDAAPAGVDARFAWGIAGGKGEGVQVVDIEGDWNFSHEDLPSSPGQVAGGNPGSGGLSWRNHGTAVVGEIAGKENGIGVTGISPRVTISAIAHFPTASSPGWGSASAIEAAADRCNAGDIILLEMHRPGPAFNFQFREDQQGFIAVEWWWDDFLAIQYATSKGIIVVEAAGNGAQNLDAPIYSVRPATSPVVFPAAWKNPFPRTAVDSRAIIVGAGAPPSGNFGAARSRLGFSNYGSCADAQAWGREVVTTGYGDLAGATNENAAYSAIFSGTSSASPIVVGALACIQGMLKAAGKPLLTPLTARQLLRSTGTPQPAGSGRIGNLPDIRAMANQLQIPTGGGGGGGGGGNDPYVAYLTQVIYYARWYPELQACLRSQICGNGAPGTCSSDNQQMVNDVRTVLSKCPPNYKDWFCQNL